MRSNRRGAFLAISIGAGVAIGVALKNVAVGVAIGVAFGFVLMAIAGRRERG